MRKSEVSDFTIRRKVSDEQEVNLDGWLDLICGRTSFSEFDEVSLEGWFNKKCGEIS